MNFLQNLKVTRVMNAVAAGTSNQTGSTVDMQGFEGVAFIALFGTLSSGAVTGIKAQQGQASGMGDAADLEGSALAIDQATGSNKALVLEIFKPLERYVRPIVTRSTGNAVIDGVIAIQWAGRVKPPTQDSSVANSKVLVSPAEGTA